MIKTCHKFYMRFSALREVSVSEDLPVDTDCISSSVLFVCQETSQVVPYRLHF